MPVPPSRLARPRSCAASTSSCGPARSTPSWARTGRASPRWPARCSASPEYEVTGGRILFQGDDITDWPTDVRAKAGMFLAFQYPQEIAGVSVIQFLRQALSARKGIDLSVLELRLAIMEWMKRLDMDPSFADRYLNEGFSGGEKKRNEILQMAILEPELAILDETDSGLDIDALRIVAKGIDEVRADRPELGVVLITHYQRLLDELHARPGAHPGRRPHRRQRRPRAGRAARARGLRGMAERVTDDTASTSPAIRRTSRSSTAMINGKRIVYLDSAATSQKPRAVHRRDGRASTRRRTRQLHRSVYQLAAEATEALRDGPAEGARASSTRRATHEVHLHQERHRGPQPRRPVLGPGQPARGRRRGAHPDGAPRQHRAVAHPRRRAGHRAALGRRSPPTASSTSPTSTRCSTGPRRSASPPCRTCSARITPVRRLTDAAHAAGAARHRRRLPVRAPRAHRRAGHGRRLRRLLGPQDVRPDGHRRAVGPRGAARRHAAVPRRRRHDPRRPPRRLHADRAAGEVRGRHAADRRGRSGSAPPSTTSTSSAWPTCAAHEMELTGYAHRHARPSAFGDDITHPRPRQRRGARRRALASPSATCTPTTSPRCSTRRTCACGPATTAPSRSCACSA